MKSETTQAMQEALEAAVARMQNGNGAPSNGPAPPTDLMGALMSILPKLLQDNEANEEIFEKLEAKIDGLQKGDLTALREQVLVLRKQCHRLLKGQEVLMASMQEIQKQQAVTSDLLVEVAQHMARVQIISDLSDDVRDDPYDDRREHLGIPVPGSQARGGTANGEERRSRQRAVKNQNRARS